MGCDPSRSMGFEMVSEFIEKLLTDIGRYVGIKEKTVMHEDVLEVEERGLGDDLGWRRIQMGVNSAGGGCRFPGDGVCPCISVAEGVVWRWGVLGVGATSGCELMRVDMDEGKMVGF